MIASLRYENEVRSKQPRLIAGFDEVGRGCMAGPLVVGAYMFPATITKGVETVIQGLRDSKALSPIKRETFAISLKNLSDTTQEVECGLGWVWPEEIDSIGITQAVDLGVVRAFQEISIKVDYALCDKGCVTKLFKFWKLPYQEIIKGDNHSLSIAAASIVAKVARDQYMEGIARIYPEYGFETHKGYVTTQHKAAVKAYGILEIHRKSFKPIKDLINSQHNP